MKHEHFAWFEHNFYDRIVRLEVTLWMRHVIDLPNEQELLRHRVCEILVIDISHWANRVYFMHGWTGQKPLTAGEIKRKCTNSKLNDGLTGSIAYHFVPFCWVRDVFLRHQPYRLSERIIFSNSTAKLKMLKMCKIYMENVWFFCSWKKSFMLSGPRLRFSSNL